MTKPVEPRLKHEKVALVLEAEIRAGRVPIGRQLPSESALAERFAVSRNTVRAALSELGRTGLIATRSGKGSFVTFDGRPLDVQLGWARALQETGADTRVDVLRVDEVDDPALAVELGAESARFLRIDRLRSIVDGAAISCERSRIPATPAVSAAVADGLAAGSLTRLLTDAGLVAARGEQWVEVRPLSPDDAALLDRAPGEAFLWSRCVTRDTAGRLVENVESLLDPAHFRLHVEFA